MQQKQIISLLKQEVVKKYNDERMNGVKKRKSIMNEKKIKSVANDLNDAQLLQVRMKCMSRQTQMTLAHLRYQSRSVEKYRVT